MSDHVTVEVVRADTGNADILVMRHAHELRHCEELRSWYSWDGMRWRKCAAESEITMAARGSVEAMQVEPGDKDLAAHKLRSLSRRALENMVALAKCSPDMRVGLAQLDSDPYALNTPDGIVDLRTGGCTPHAPEGWHTKITGVGFDLYYPPVRWMAFLDSTFGGDAELIAYMQRLAGLAAIGRVSHHVLPFLFGGGSNGKSVLMDVLTAVLGDYAITAPANFLLAGRDRHETEIARQHGARMVVCSEINQGSKFDEAKVKVLTGGDVLSGRYMRQDFFDFVPSHTLFLMGNHRPQVTAGGVSFWRRCKVIPFLHTVPPQERIEGLDRQLVTEEGSAILAWVVQGAMQVVAGGPLQEPEAVAGATAEYSEDTKSGVARFLDEVCTVGGLRTSVAAAVHASYQEWAQANGEPQLSIQKFGLDMRDEGVLGPPRTNKGKSYFLTVHTDRLPAIAANRITHHRSSSAW